MRSAVGAVILSCFAVVAVAQEQGAEKQIIKDEIQLRASVKAIVPLQDFSGKVFPVDTDPHFAVTVSVISVVPAIADFNPHAIVTFGIHSPTIVFAGDAKYGKTYNFSLCRETERGKVRFSGFGIRLAHGATLGGCG
jgi:hypothetical protein